MPSDGDYESLRDNVRFSRTGLSLCLKRPRNDKGRYMLHKNSQHAFLFPPFLSHKITPAHMFAHIGTRTLEQCTCVYYLSPPRNHPGTHFDGNVKFTPHCCVQTKHTTTLTERRNMDNSCKRTRTQAKKVAGEEDEY